MFMRFLRCFCENQDACYGPQVLEIVYVGHTVLPDSSTLLAVMETQRGDRGEVTTTESYVLKAGSWWGKTGVVSHRDPKHVRLTEIAMRQVVRGAVDSAVGL